MFRSLLFCALMFPSLAFADNIKVFGLSCDRRIDASFCDGLQNIQNKITKPIKRTALDLIDIKAYTTDFSNIAELNDHNLNLDYSVGLRKFEVIGSYDYDSTHITTTIQTNLKGGVSGVVEYKVEF